MASKLILMIAGLVVLALAIACALGQEEEAAAEETQVAGEKANPCGHIKIAKFNRKDFFMTQAKIECAACCKARDLKPWVNRYGLGTHCQCYKKLPLGFMWSKAEERQN